MTLWASYTRGHVGPQGYPNHSPEQSSNTSRANDPEWPPQVWLIENAMSMLRRRSDGSRRERVIHFEYLYGFRTIKDKAIAIKIRRSDYPLYVDETERLLLDIVVKIDKGTKN